MGIELEGSNCGAYPYITKMDYNCQNMLQYVGECGDGTSDEMPRHYIEKYSYDCHLNVSSIKIAQNFLYIPGTSVTITVFNRHITISIVGETFDELHDNDSLYLDTGTQIIKNCPIHRVNHNTVKIYKDGDANGTLDGIVNQTVAITPTSCYAELRHQDTKPYERRKWSLRDRYFYA